MCMLFGFNFKEEVKFAKLWQTFSKYSYQNPHGWGIAIIIDDMPFIVKRSSAAHKSRLAKELNSTTMIGQNGIFHLRYATKGKICNKNAHPFNIHKWAFAHNGHITKKLSTKTQPFGETDSEKAFCYLYDNLEMGNDEWKTISRIVSEIGIGFNFLLAKEDILYAYWSGYNSLRYAKIKDLGFIICTYPIFQTQWLSFQKKELIKFQNGKIIRREVIE